MFEILHPTLLHVTVPPAKLCQGEVDNLLVHLCWHGASNTSRFRCYYIRFGYTVCYATSFINWRSHTVIFVYLPYRNLNKLGVHWLNTISSSHLVSFPHARTPTGCAARWPGWPRWPLRLSYIRLDYTGYCTISFVSVYECLPIQNPQTIYIVPFTAPYDIISPPNWRPRPDRKWQSPCTFLSIPWLNAGSSSPLGSFPTGHSKSTSIRTAGGPGWPGWPPWRKLRTVIKLFLKLVQ